MYLGTRDDRFSSICLAVSISFTSINESTLDDNLLKSVAK